MSWIEMPPTGNLKTALDGIQSSLDNIARQLKARDMTLYSWANAPTSTLAALIEKADRGELDLEEDCGWKVGDERKVTFGWYGGQFDSPTYIETKATLVLAGKDTHTLEDPLPSGKTTNHFTVLFKDFPTIYTWPFTSYTGVEGKINYYVSPEYAHSCLNNLQTSYISNFGFNFPEIGIFKRFKANYYSVTYRDNTTPVNSQSKDAKSNCLFSLLNITNILGPYSTSDYESIQATNENTLQNRIRAYQTYNGEKALEYLANAAARSPISVFQRTLGDRMQRTGNTSWTYYFRLYNGNISYDADNLLTTTTPTRGVLFIGCI